jgi:hypothetical protein
MWWQIIESYSKCALTYRRDKLVAISGIARKIQLQTNEQYIAGMWREGLEGQLCWTTKLPKRGCISDRSVYRAPSWSWAATDHVIQRGIPDPRRSLVEILHVDISLAGDDPFGEVVNGELTLSCSALLSASITYHTGSYQTFGSHYWSACDVKAAIKGTWVKVIADFDDEPADIESWKKHVGHDICLLPISSIFDVDENQTRMQGLLLQPTHKAGGQYRRLGHFLTGRPSTSLADYQTAMQACRKRGGLGKNEIFARNYMGKKGIRENDGVAKKAIVLV